jgi:hypothetical protein
VAGRFHGGAHAALVAFIDGEPGLVWRHAGEVKVAFVFRFEGDLVSGIEQIGDPATIAGLTIEVG